MEELIKQRYVLLVVFLITVFGGIIMEYYKTNPSDFWYYCGIVVLIISAIALVLFAFAMLLFLAKKYVNSKNAEFVEIFKSEKVSFLEEVKQERERVLIRLKKYEYAIKQDKIMLYLLLYEKTFEGIWVGGNNIKLPNSNSFKPNAEKEKFIKRGLKKDFKDISVSEIDDIVNDYVDFLFTYNQDTMPDSDLPPIQ